jgi:TolB-like protein
MSRILFLFLIAALLEGLPFCPQLLVAQKRPIRELKKSGRDEGPEKNFAAALRLFKDRKGGEARDILERTVRNHPGHVKSLVLLAAILFENGKYDAAELVLRRALKLEPRHHVANLLASRIAEAQKKYLRAFEYLRRAGKASSGDEFDLGYESNVDALQKRLHSSLTSLSSRPVDFSMPSEDEPVTTNVPTIDESSRLRVAVFAFGTAGPDSTLSGASVSEMFTTAMVQTRCFMVVERHQLDKVLHEQDLELSDVMDQETAVKVGELIGVDAVVVGSLSPLGSRTEIDVRLVNTATGVVRCAANSGFDALEKTRAAVNDLAAALARAAYP